MNNNHDPYTVAFIVMSGFLVVTILLMRYEETVRQAHKRRVARARRRHAQRVARSRANHPTSRKVAR